MKLLLAEDDADIRRALVTIFEKYNYSIDAVTDGSTAYSYCVDGKYDGIILDIMMPVMSGLDVLKALRLKGVTTPVMLLSAKGETEDRITGFDAGADDYLPKPFAASELTSRVRAMLRRRSEYQPDIVTVGGLSLDKGMYEIAYDGKKERLVTREYQVLELLMENAGHVVPTDRIMEHIWGWDSEVEVSIVWVTVSNIRKKLLGLGAPPIIRAVRGVGYLIDKATGIEPDTPEI